MNTVQYKVKVIKKDVDVHIELLFYDLMEKQMNTNSNNNSNSLIYSNFSLQNVNC